MISPDTSTRPVSRRTSLVNRLKPYLAPLLNLTLYPLSRLAPRSRQRWAFGHIHDTFSGNPKYLYLWMTIHRPDLSVTWITGSEKTFQMLQRGGYPVAMRWSARGILAALRAAVFISGHGVQHVNLQLSRGALYVNLWHGVGLKATQFGDEQGSVSRAHREARGSLFKRAALLDYLVQPDILVTTSDKMQEHFASQFRMPTNRLPQLGYPRNDPAVDERLRAAAEAIDARSGFAFPQTFAEIHIYMPTFRDSGRPFMEAALPRIAELNTILRERNALLYIKPHPRTEVSIVTDSSNIRFWPDEIDFYTYLDRFDGLITDYSSVLYDFLLVKDTGAVLYTFDLDEYLASDRTLLYPFDENVAGLRVNDFDELRRVLGSGEAVGGTYARQLALVRERFWGGSCVPASPAVVAHVEAILRSGRPAERRGSRPA